MLRLNSLEQVDAFTNRLYTGDKGSSSAFFEYGWRGVTNAVGLPLLSAVLEHSTSTYSILFACNAVTECIEELFTSHNDLAEFTYNALAVLSKRYDALLKPARQAFSRLVSVCVRRGYGGSELLRALPGRLSAHLCTLCSEAVISNPNELCCMCEVLTGIVRIMDGADGGGNSSSSSAGAGYTEVSATRAFMNTDLHVVYEAAVTCARRGHTSPRPILHCSLVLLQTILAFDFNCRSAVAEETEAEWVSRDFPSQWASLLVRPALFDRLWELYRADASTQAECEALLEVLMTLVALKSSLFSNPHTRRAWLVTALTQSQLIVERRVHLEGIYSTASDGTSSNTVTLLAQLLTRVKPNYSLGELVECDVFPHWLAASCQLTVEALEGQQQTEYDCSSATIPGSGRRTELPGCALPLLNMWARLAEARSYTGEAAAALSPHLSRVLDSYLALLSRRSAWVTESSLTRSVAEAESVLEGDAEGVRLELGFVVAAVIASGDGDEGLWRPLTNAVCSTVEQLRSARVVAASALASWDSGGVDSVAMVLDWARAVEDAGWVLRLLAAAFDSCGGCPFPAALASLARCGLHVMRLTMGPEAERVFGPQLFPHVVRMHLEEAASAALTGLWSALVAPPRKVQLFMQQLVQQLTQSGDVNTAAHTNSSGAVGAVKECVLDLVAHRVWGLLSAPHISEAAHIAALELLSRIASTPSAIATLASTQAYHKFMNLEEASIPPAAVHSIRVRMRYAKCVAALRFLDTNATSGSGVVTSAALAHFVAPVCGRLARVVSFIEAGATEAGEEADRLLALSLAEWRGVLTSAVRRQYLHILELLEPSLGSVAQYVLATHASGTSCLIPQLLKLVVEMTSNTSQRIAFGANSARGVHLMRFASAVVCGAAPLAQAALSIATARPLLSGITHDGSMNADGGDGEGVEWGWKVLRLLLQVTTNALRGGFCNLGVLYFYKDVALNDLLEAAWGLVQTVGRSRDGQTRPKVVLASVGCVSEMSLECLEWFWTQQIATSVNAAVGLVESAALSLPSLTAAAQGAGIECLERLILCTKLRAVLLAADPQLVHRLTTRCLERLLLVRGTASGGAIGRVLLTLVRVEGPGLGAVADYFCSCAASPAAVEGVRAAFTVLQQASEAEESEGREETTNLRDATAELVVQLRGFM